MSPPGTPVARTSASSAARASSNRSSRQPPASASPSVSATARAELDDSPEPSGTVEPTARRRAGTWAPRSVRAATAPATKRPHGGSTVAGGSVPSAATSTVPSTSSEVALTRGPEPGSPPGPGANARRQSRSIAIGNTNPSQ